MNLDLETRPLSDMYSADIARLRQSEINAIVARHRANYESHRLLAAAEKQLNPIKETL